MMFDVGQKVRCVNNKLPKGFIWAADKPKVGGVYTVAGVGFSPQALMHGVLLQEIKNSDQHAGVYNPNRFRPLIDDTKAVKRTIKKYFGDHVKQTEDA